MLINCIIEIRDTFAFPAENPEDDTELQAKNRETLNLCGDIAVIPNLFKTRTQGPRSWQLYSLLYDVDTVPEFEQAVELFSSENPGDTGVMGAWYFDDGTQVSDDGVPIYPIPESLLSYMPDVWNEDDPPTFSPATEVTDVNLYFGQAPRQF